VNGFVQDEGEVTQNGVIEVGEGQGAGGSGRELLLYNASVSGSFTSPASGMTMLFSDYSGSLNMAINRDFRRFANFADLQQQVVGGVSVAVSKGQGDGQGSLTLSGPLQSFTVGGEELGIDQICFK
jgi:hypothetical protein